MYTTTAAASTTATNDSTAMPRDLSLTAVLTGITCAASLLTLRMTYSMYCLSLIHI